MRSERKYFDLHQPQTLQIAVTLLYARALFMVLFGILGDRFSPGDVAFTLLGVIGAYAIANERKLGFVLAITSVGLTLAFLVLPLDFLIEGPADIALSLMINIALLALLVHPESQHYRRIWFK